MIKNIRVIYLIFIILQSFCKKTMNNKNVILFIDCFVQFDVN